MVESPSKGHKRRHGEVPGGPDHHREPDNEDDRGPREKKKKNENNSEVKIPFPFLTFFFVVVVWGSNFDLTHIQSSKSAPDATLMARTVGKFRTVADRC